MEHRLLRSFVAVAEELHFGRAAKRLHISQPPLSIQIQKLERDLGAKLFERTQRHVALTPAGEELLGRARHLLAEAERASIEVQRIARGEAGVLAIGYSATATHAVLPRVVPAFRAAHRGVRLELREMRSALQPEALRDRRIDLGLACAPVDANPHEIDSIPLVREALVVVLPRAHPLARRPALRPKDIDGAPYVGVRPDIEPAWAGASIRALRAAGVSFDVVQETDTKIALLGLVAAGIGISVVSESMAMLARRGVVFRPLRGIALRLELAALVTRTPSPAAAAFLALSRARVTAS